jgi:hypothetical protein
VHRSLIALLCCVAACSDRPAAAKPETAKPAAGPGSIEGDVYLMMKSGDTKRGAGRLVALFRADDSLEARTRGICGAFATSLRPIIAQLESLKNDAVKHPGYGATPLFADLWGKTNADLARVTEAMRVRYDAALLTSAAETTGSGASAHYAFPRVPAGKYLVFSSWPIGDVHHYAWIAPVEVAAGQHVKRDLDNSVETSDQGLYCGAK